MVFMGINPLLKTIVLGGVATGNINAQDAEIVAAANIGNTGKSSSIVNARIMGNIIAAVARLELISVKKLMPATRISIKISSGILFNNRSNSPM